jgi:hypothetical protein
VGSKTIFSKTAVKMPSKSIKKTLFNKSTFTDPTDWFDFRIFTLVLPLIRGAPLSPLVFSDFWLAEIQAIARNNPQKTELQYLHNWIFYKFTNKYRRHICAGSALRVTTCEMHTKQLIKDFEALMSYLE